MLHLDPILMNVILCKRGDSCISTMQVFRHSLGFLHKLFTHSTPPALNWNLYLFCRASLLEAAHHDIISVQ